MRKILFVLSIISMFVCAVPGQGNTVNQMINQNAKGYGIDQNAINYANLIGQGNTVNQMINQNAKGYGIDQNAINYANLIGQGNTVNQEVKQDARGLDILQSSYNSVGTLMTYGNGNNAGLYARVSIGDNS
jgi:hypothetical protein